jgi:MFS family permease
MLNVRLSVPKCQLHRNHVCHRPQFRIGSGRLWFIGASPWVNQCRHRVRFCEFLRNCEPATNMYSPDPNLSWVSLSYLLTNSVGLILVGRITDIFGRRWIFIVGNLVSLIGSIVGATANNIPTLIAAEVCFIVSVLTNMANTAGQTLLGLGAAVQLSYACEPPSG